MGWTLESQFIRRILVKKETFNELAVWMVNAGSFIFLCGLSVYFAFTEDLK